MFRMREHKRKDQRDAVWPAVSAKIKTKKCHFIFIRNNNVFVLAIHASSSSSSCFQSNLFVTTVFVHFVEPSGLPTELAFQEKACLLNEVACTGKQLLQLLDDD